jgi:pimeloyl-ACP methyl ester carboxylesterase
MAEQIPNAKLVSIAKAGHLSPIEAPEIFARAIKNFLGETL